MNSREVISIIEARGFVFDRDNGHAVYKHPNGRSVPVPVHPGDIAKGTLNSIWEKAGFPEYKNMTRRQIELYDRRQANAAAAGSQLDNADSVLVRSDNQGFFMGRDGNVSVVMNEEQRAIVVTRNGTQEVRHFDSIDDTKHAFGQYYDQEARRLQAAGLDPEVRQFSGSYDDIARAFRSSTGKMARIGNTLADVGRFLGKTAKVLGPLGVVGATAEAAELGMHAHEMVDFGLLEEEALLEYDALLAGFIAQATADPSMVGGELVVQTAFDAWYDKYDVPDYLRESLEPSSLLETFAELFDSSLSDQLSFMMASAAMPNYLNGSMYDGWRERWEEFNDHLAEGNQVAALGLLREQLNAAKQHIEQAQEAYIRKNWDRLGFEEHGIATVEQAREFMAGEGYYTIYNSVNGYGRGGLDQFYSPMRREYHDLSRNADFANEIAEQLYENIRQELHSDAEIPKPADAGHTLQETVQTAPDTLIPAP